MNESCVLVVREYASQSICKRLDEFLQQSPASEYTHEVRTEEGLKQYYYGVNRFGTPLNSTYGDHTGEKRAVYFKEALPTLRAIREAASPFLSPIDKLRLELDEYWLPGANLGTWSGNKLFCGIGRMMPYQLSHLSAEQPHIDAVPSEYFPHLAGQFAANIYLNVPAVGGELEIWPVAPISTRASKNFIPPALWREVLPASLIVKPNNGDLLLFNTRRPHAITAFETTPVRTSLQTFLGLNGDRSLFFWD